MNYWLDLFTGTTWEEFLRAGAKVSGFRERMRKAVDRVAPGDVLLCYLTGVKRWVGALKVTGRSADQRNIWSFDGFPERLNVEPLVVLTPENGVPMAELEGKMDFYASPAHKGGFKGFLRMSPNLFQRSGDGTLLLKLRRRRLYLDPSTRSNLRDSPSTGQNSGAGNAQSARLSLFPTGKRR